MPALKQVQTDSDYHKQTALNDIKKLNSQLKELPGFCRDFSEVLSRQRLLKHALVMRQT